ncbi:MAG: hypothetical protein IJS74_02875 [Clostridia bacterium]|nr:hypothetical protein [Clostridia bacterium]
MTGLIYNIVVCSIIDVIVSVIVPEGGTRGICLMVVSLYMFYCVLSYILQFLQNFTFFA